MSGVLELRLQHQAQSLEASRLLDNCKLDLQLPPSEAQGMLIPLRGAWALKPLWGTLTDAFPLCGYRYKPYVGLMGALGCIAMVLLFSLPPSTALAACCFLMISICTGWVDVLCNAVITSACRAEADGGRKGAADLQAMSIAVFAVGSLVGNALGGLMFTLSGGSARQCFGLSTLFPAALLLLARSMDEPKAAPSGSGGGSRLESVRGAYEALRPAGAGGGAVLQAALFVALSAAIVPVCIMALCSAEERERRKNYRIGLEQKTFVFTRTSWAQQLGNRSVLNGSGDRPVDFCVLR